MTNTLPPEPLNADVVQGLREVADFLEAHPDLPRVNYSFTTIGSGYGRNPNAREHLTAVAHALGDRAEERFSSRQVSIRGNFSGGVHLDADARVEDLIENPSPAPEYEPIIAREDDE